MPYSGESIRVIGVYQLAPTVDYDLADDLQFRAGTRTLAAGTEWKAYADEFNTGSIYLPDPGEPVTVSWVVEVASGSGTVAASEVLDTGYGDPDTVASIPLGTAALTAGTNVIASTFTGADVYDAAFGSTSGWHMLRLEGVSGSVEVSQVKLRVWPVGGAVGGYVTHPAFDTDPEDVTIYGTVATGSGGEFSGSATAGTAEAAWDAATDNLVADVSTLPGPHLGMTAASGTYTATSVASIAGNVIDIVGPVWDSVATVTTRMLVARSFDWSLANPIAPDLVEGVDWVRHPNEVAGDDDYLAVQLGSITTHWLDAVVYVSTSGGSPLGSTSLAVHYPGSVTVESSGGFWDVTADYDLTGQSPVGDGATVAINPPGRYAVVIPSNLITAVPPMWPAPPGSYTYGDTVNATLGSVELPVQTYATMPPYRVWVPDAVVEEPLRLRQRGDSLAQGSVRVRGVGSQQFSVRVRGYL